VPIVKIYGLSAGLRALPPEEANRFVLELSISIKREIAGVSELGITTDHIDVFVVADHNLKVNDVIVEVVGLTKKPERTHDVIQNVARIVRCAVGNTVGEFQFSVVGLIEVFVYSFDRTIDGFSSE